MSPKISRLAVSSSCREALFNASSCFVSSRISASAPCSRFATSEAGWGATAATARGGCITKGGASVQGVSGALISHTAQTYIGPRSAPQAQARAGQPLGQPGKLSPFLRLPGSHCWCGSWTSGAYSSRLSSSHVLQGRCSTRAPALSQRTSTAREPQWGEEGEERVHDAGQVVALPLRRGP